MAFRRHRRISSWCLAFLGIVIFLYSLFTYLFPNSKPLEVKRLMQISNNIDSVTVYSKSSPSSCISKTNIFFLKTHKCASSTVQNVLLRYGTSRKLNFVLPTLGNYLGNQKPFHRLMATNAPWYRFGYNIFCHHTVFNEVEVAAIMPNDTIYVSMLRDPVDLFVSLYSYARLDLHYKQTIEEFASSNITLHSFTDRSGGYLGLNQMLYDFGISPRNYDNVTIVREAATNIERRFSLIMISEHFEESMILLKDLLCWSLDDVVYFQHNVRKVEAKRRLSDDTRNNLRVLNRADDYLYKHFLNVFWQKVENYGVERMRVDVAALRKRNNELLEFCKVGVVASDDEQKPSEQNVFLLSNVVQLLHFANKNATCYDLSDDELHFTNRLLKRQFAMAVESGLLRKVQNRLLLPTLKN